MLTSPVASVAGVAAGGRHRPVDRRRSASGRRCWPSCRGRPATSPRRRGPRRRRRRGLWAGGHRRVRDRRAQMPSRCWRGGGRSCPSRVMSARAAVGRPVRQTVRVYRGRRARSSAPLSGVLAIAAVVGCGGDDPHELVGYRVEPVPDVGDVSAAGPHRNDGADFSLRADAGQDAARLLRLHELSRLLPEHDVRTSSSPASGSTIPSRLEVAMVTVDPARDLDVLAELRHELRSRRPRARHRRRRRPRLARLGVRGLVRRAHRLETVRSRSPTRPCCTPSTTPVRSCWRGRSV